MKKIHILKIKNFSKYKKYEYNLILIIASYYFLHFITAYIKHNNVVDFKIEYSN